MNEIFDYFEDGMSQVEKQNSFEMANDNLDNFYDKDEDYPR